jgi:hypothetical protein
MPRPHQTAKQKETAMTNPSFEDRAPVLGGLGARQKPGADGPPASPRPKPRRKRCKFCGVLDYFHWVETPAGWRFFDTALGVEHVCAELAEARAAKQTREDEERAHDAATREAQPNKGGTYGLRRLDGGRHETKDGEILFVRIREGYRTRRHTYPPVWHAVRVSDGQVLATGDSLRDVAARATA